MVKVERDELLEWTVCSVLFSYCSLLLGISASSFLLTGTFSRI